MPAFTWEGKTRKGEFKRGVMDAPNEAAVNEALRRQQIVVDKVSAAKKAASKGFSIPGLGFLGGGVGIGDLVIFTRQFATMIDAGLPLVQCLDILGTQTDNKFFGKVILDVKARVEGGSTFADGLRAHPKIFDDLFTNLVQAGEVGGILDTILNRLAAYMEKNQRLIKKVKGAMVYPATIMVVAGAVVTLLLWKVIPVFADMFKDFGGGSLPAPTQIVIDMSNWMKRNIVYVFGTIIALYVGMKNVLATKGGRRGFDKFMIKVPLFGNLIRKVAVAKFTRTLGTMISSGVPILDALDITARTAGNAVIEDGILFVRGKISEGKNMADPLADTKIFPSMVVQMIGVGEATGALDTMLTKIADFYDEEVDNAVGALTSMMEPLMMVFLGTVCGGMIIAMYLPIFEIAGNIKGG